MNAPGPLASSVESEFAGAKFGDARLTRRASEIGKLLAASPEKSFPKLASSEAELEALYRFSNNPRVTPQRILAPHRRETARRSADAKDVFAVHDTTEFLFTGERDGLGMMLEHVQGFVCHTSLAVGASADSPVLGVLGLEVILRDVPPKGSRPSLNERKWASRHIPRAQKESSRWDRGVRRAAWTLGKETGVIHVIDQEGDDFALLAYLYARGHRFIVRGSPKRLVRPAGENLHEALADQATLFEREVLLSPRSKVKARAKKGRPERQMRPARLEVRATSVELRRPQLAQTKVTSIPLNLVQVLETNPPDGEEPVEWVLLTSEPISTQAELERIIDGYRARWRIEEFFKALKSGCAIEKRQLGSKHALLNALALFVPIAWRLLLLRNLGRSPEQRPAMELFATSEIEIVRVLSRRVVLPSAPTIRDMMLAIAGLGGHLKRNGDPGWHTLGAGFERLVDAMRIREALKATCDQS